MNFDKTYKCQQTYRKKAIFIHMPLKPRKWVSADLFCSVPVIGCNLSNADFVSHFDNIYREHIHTYQSKYSRKVIK